MGSVSSLGQSQSQELESAEAEGKGSLALVARVVPAGGGEPADARRLWAAAVAGGSQHPALPLLKLGALSLPMIRMGRGWGGASAVSPRDSGRYPQPTPHCVHSLAAGGGRRSTPGPQSTSGGAGSGRWDPGLQGSGSPAPAAPPPPAPAPYATQIAQGLTPGFATSRRARRAVVREWMRATPPAGVRGYEAADGRSAGAVQHSAAPGRAMPGVTGPCLFAGPPVPTLLFPIPKPRSRCRAEGGNDSPPPGL